ncbi:MAG TPA: hypothetical protein VF520_12120 [Thermoleophilaceae bacterium]|jgi:hypothetical protein
MRRLTLAVAAAMAIMAAAPSGASAATWNGDCDMSGTLFLNPNYTVVPSWHDYELKAGGTCTGTLDGAPYHGPGHVYVDGRMGKPMSCFLGFSNGVPGVLTFGSDPSALDAEQLDLIVDEGHVGPQLHFHFTGAYGGQAMGRLAFDVGQEEVEDCLGEGIDQVPIQLQTQTIQPIYG